VFRSERYPQPWKLTGPTPPRRIETQHLVLRCWEPADAQLFASALRASRAHIGAWIPPAWDEPSKLDDIARRLEQFQAEFHAGIGFVYAMLDATESEVLGEAGLMPRIGPGALEIGYWVHVDHVGRGLATEATHALTFAGLALPEVDRIEIHCDPANVPSAAVPRRLGYRLTHPPDRDLSSPDSHSPGDLLIFALEAIDELADWAAGEPNA
jgi:RimJ/RimL family protein N-acetyltransferase